MPGRNSSGGLPTCRTSTDAPLNATAKLTTPSASVGSPVTVPWRRKRLVPRLSRWATASSALRK